MKEMQTMGPTELLEETTDFLGACLKARKMCLFLNHKIGVAWGSEYKQEVRKSSWQSVMREIEIMEELLL